MFLLRHWIPGDRVGASGNSCYRHESDVGGFVRVFGGGGGEVVCFSVSLGTEFCVWNHVVTASPVRCLVQLGTGEKVQRDSIDRKMY